MTNIQYFKKGENLYPFSMVADMVARRFNISISEEDEMRLNERAMNEDFSDKDGFISWSYNYADILFTAIRENDEAMAFIRETFDNLVTGDGAILEILKDRYTRHSNHAELDIIRGVTCLLG